jgi:hypothetical protein
MGAHGTNVTFLILRGVAVSIKQVETGLAHGAGALIAEAVLAVDYGF